MRGKRNPETGEVMEVESRVYKPSEAGPEPTETTETPRRKTRRREEPPTNPVEGAKRAGPARRAAVPPGTAPLAAETELLSSPLPGGPRARAQEQKTVTYRPGSDAKTHESVAASADDSMDDAIVGWLVAVDGPGKGQSRRLGYGVNTLGRGGSSRVQLDFGDDEISRDDHATVTYDPKGRRFYLQHGGGRNLTYLGDEPVLAPTPLEACQQIVLGATTFRFVALCGPDFDWQDLD